MTYQPKHFSVRLRSAPGAGLAGQERTGGAHAGPYQGVPHAGRPASSAGRATGLFLAGWLAAFVGLQLLGACSRPDDAGTDHVVDNRCAELDSPPPGCEEQGLGVGRDRPGGPAAVWSVAPGGLAQSEHRPVHLLAAAAAETAAQAATPENADSRAHPVKSGSAVRTPGA
jgi:hypothetical protein